MSACGCVIGHDEEMNTIGTVGRRWTARIIYCPLHESAARLRAFVEAFVYEEANNHSVKEAIDRARTLLGETGPMAASLPDRLAREHSDLDRKGVARAVCVALDAAAKIARDQERSCEEWATASEDPRSIDTWARTAAKCRQIAGAIEALK